MPLVVNWNRKSAIKYEKKQSAKEKSVKNKQISIKISPKTSNPQVFKKTAIPQKKQDQIRGKTARLATMKWSIAHKARAWANVSQQWVVTP